MIGRSLVVAAQAVNLELAARVFDPIRNIMVHSLPETLDIHRRSRYIYDQDPIMSVPRSRILDLMRVQCRIFSSTFNPERLRTGNKVLRERLKGPSVAAYYPRKVVSFKDLKNLFPDLETWDEDEEDRLDNVAILKSRGKGAPKKKTSADQSKKILGKRRKPAGSPSSAAPTK